MTSLFYDVIRLEAVGGGSNVPLLTAFGESEPQNVVGHRFDPIRCTSLRNNAYFERLCVKMHPRVTSIGESKKKIKKKISNTSRNWTDVLIRPIGTNFGFPFRVVDIINCAKFYCNRLRGLDSVRGRSLTIPFGLRCRR